MHELTDERLRELLPRLRRFALSLTRHSSAADDLVQACLERALTHGAGRRADGDLRAWLFSILYRRFLDGQRRAKRHARLLSFFGGDEPLAPSAEELAVAHSTLEGFNRLGAEQRALLLLVGVEGLSYREAAEALDVPIGTVMSRLSRARQALRELTEGQITTTSLRVLK
jgi:RNA polymerase sigma-70 factor (ECF subfamily)